MKAIRRTPPIILLSIVAVWAMGADDEQTDEQKVPAPFVTRLTAQVVDTSVELSWRKSSDIEGPFLIYRSEQAIDEASFAQAQFLARVDPDEEWYTDYPPFEQEVYYVVLAEDEDNKVYELFLEYRNKTTTGIMVSAPKTEEELAAQISGLQAQVLDDAVLVGFETSNPERELLLFRSTKPIRDADDFLESTSPIMLEAGTTSYRDYPFPDVPYFYAVVDAGLFKQSKENLRPGKNTLLEPIRIPPIISVDAALPPRSQALPLPFLILPLSATSEDGLSSQVTLPLPDEVALSPSTAKAIAKVLAQAEPADPPKPTVQIIGARVTGEDKAEELELLAIVDQYLGRGRYRDAEKYLRAFLQVNHSQDVQARAHFYLAQAQFFQKQRREALLEFLLAQDRYYADVQPWINACLLSL